MRPKKVRYFVGDFETTVFDGQVRTDVWASASVELGTEDVQIFHTIGEQFKYFCSLDTNIICYYHNLKFDGSFWLSYLLTETNITQAVEKLKEDEPNGEVNVNNLRFTDKTKLKNNTFVYSISGMGQWYSITIRYHKHTIEFRDSLKLLPFSVKVLGSQFKTKHRKLEMEYKGVRYPGCDITPEERQYIANDVLVVKEAIEIMFEQGHKRLTIGSCCLAEYKKIVTTPIYDMRFPDVYSLSINESMGATSVGDWVHKSYGGGWCYLAKGKASKIYHKGVTADVNSLYPSMMHSESGNRYPIGYPTMWEGNYIPEEAMKPDKYFFVRVRTRFYLKPGYLPFIHIKNSLFYKSTESLETSDILSRKDGKYYPCYRDFDGTVKPAIVEMTLTMTDYELIKEHYDLVDFTILDGMYFNTAIGIFDEYIDKYKKIKQTSKGAIRQTAKLFLNNLYGKLASSPNSNFKIAYIKDDKSLGFITVVANDKTPGYIPVGSAITSYARNFTIRAAQKNYHGPDKPGFIYADTDSIHCDLDPSAVQGIKVHPTNFCCWDLESTWDIGYFVRQKTYIEHVIAEELEPVDPYYNVKCAGMPDRCKKLFLLSVQGYNDDTYAELTDEQKHFVDGLSADELEFIKTKHELTDFNVGLKVPGKLLPKRIPGGVLLKETTYEMR